MEVVKGREEVWTETPGEWEKERGAAGDKWSYGGQTPGKEGYFSKTGVMLR